MVFHVKARGYDLSADSLFPPRYKGNKALLVNGNVWFYKSELNRHIPVARRQQRKKLWKIADYVDLVTTNYLDNYVPTALADEIVDGQA